MPTRPNEPPHTPRPSGSRIVSREDARAQVEPLVDTTLAAELLGVAPRTLRAWLAAGALPATRLSSRCVRVRLSDVQAYINARTIAAER